MSGRRSLFGGLAAAVMLPAVAPLATAIALEPDAVLIQLCGEFHIINSQVAVTDDDDARMAILDRRWDTSDQVESLVPATQAGQAAKVGVALALLRENHDANDSYERFALQTLRDLAGGAK